MAVHADLVVESRVEDLAHVRGWVADHARAVGFDERAIRELSLVVSEACVNIIRHAYGGEPNHPIGLHLAIDEEKLALSIHDEGARFDLESYRPPDLDEPQEHGYGVFIIHNLMDEVCYETSQGPGTTLRLVKYRDGRSGQGDPERQGGTDG
jgi:anti-sigma regulatory factor (Ser/Thr protein kinase)